MADGAGFRLRLRLENGAEFEAEGSEDFVRAQIEEFKRTAPKTPPKGGSAPESDPIQWDLIVEEAGRDIALRAKLGRRGSAEEACLILMAAGHKMLDYPKPTALQIAKWIRKSGYPILRMDRILQNAVSQGHVLASGSRRARRYELSPSGRLKAYLSAEKLAGLVSGNPA